MNRPKIVVYTVASTDGRVAITPDATLLHGDERMDAVAGSSEEVYKWIRVIHNPQVILEGSGSFVTEEEVPEPLPPFAGDLNLLYNDFLPEPVVHDPGRQGWFTAVDSRGRVRGWIKEFEGWEGWHILILVSHNTPPEYLAYLQSENIPYIMAGSERVDLTRAMEKLKSHLGVSSVLSTAGGKLNGALLRAGLVDEINIEFFPAIIGGFKTPSLYDSPELKPDEWPTRLKLISALVQDNGHVWLRYEVVKQ
ncbi:MAG: dihydrofolate reductase family protein [Theionarchaea archaeon]|nr:dihydrofolate reductase family protein [Theionarchaea archaeon]